MPTRVHNRFTHCRTGASVASRPHLFLLHQSSETSRQEERDRAGFGDAGCARVMKGNSESDSLVKFLNDIATPLTGREIHVIADNLSTRKTQAVRTFLVEHPNVRLHFTPTYLSWLPP